MSMLKDLNAFLIINHTSMNLKPVTVDLIDLGINFPYAMPKL